MAAKGLIIFIAIWTMIQSIGYGILSALAIMAHSCQIDMTNSRVIHLFYALYFRDSKCGAINWNLIFDQNVPAEMEPIMPDVTQMAFRTYIIAIVYFSLSVLWLLTSVLLLVGTCSSCTSGNCRYYTLFSPFIFVTVLTVLADAAATGLFIYDLTNSTTFESLLSYLQVENVSQILTYVDVPGYFLVVPATILICISSRIVVFWILNFATIFVVCSMGKRVVFRNKNRQSVQMSAMQYEEMNYASNGNNRTTMVPIIPKSDHQKRNIHAPSRSSPIDQTRYNDPNHYQFANAEYQRPQKKNSKNLNPLSNERRYVEPLKGGDDDGYSDRRSRSEESTASSSRNTQSPSGDISYVSGKSDEKRISIDRPQYRPIPAPKPKSKNNQAIKDELMKQHVIDQQRQSVTQPPDELRGQLPWSYFTNRDDLSKPKKTFDHLREDEDLPPVPVPDYTLHFARKDRGIINNMGKRSSHENEQWSGPEMRY